MKEIRISDISGIKIGHAQNFEGGTGCTAIICEKGAVAGAAVRGGGPATRETDLLKPENLIQQIHCVMLSGGSAYGLDACSGAMQFLEENEIGFDVGAGIVPIVCGASLFDLIVGDPMCRPDKSMGYEACNNAGISEAAEGSVGAGTGASVGKYYGSGRMMKSGLGIFAVQLGEVQCAAVVAVNALGDVFDCDTGTPIAGLLTPDRQALSSTEKAMYSEIDRKHNVFSGNTTIGCVITNAILSKTQCAKLASVAHNGFARVIRPVHTSVDGDAVFVMATGEVSASPDALGALATEVMARAINRAVRAAKTAYGLPSASDIKSLT